MSHTRAHAANRYAARAWSFRFSTADYSFELTARAEAANHRGLSVELTTRRRLLRSEAARDDVRAVVVLAAHRRAGGAAQHHQLADVRERVGNRALEDPFGRRGDRRVRRQMRVEALQGVEKARDFTIP